MDQLSIGLRRRNARGGACSDDGQAAVELALALPVVAFLLLAIVQFALVARDELLVVHAAREAARAASVGASGATAGSRVLPGATVSISGGRRVGDLVVASVSYRSVTNLALVGPLIPDVVLHFRVTMREEHPG